MSDPSFYLTAAMIGAGGGLVSQVLALQQSLKIKADLFVLDRRKVYYDTVIQHIGEEKKRLEAYIQDLEKRIAESRDTPEDATETQYKQFHMEAKQRRGDLDKAITAADKLRNDLLNEFFSLSKANFIGPWLLTLLNILVAGFVGWLFGFVEVSTKGTGQAQLTTSLVMEFLFAGAFWPLIWQRLFNTGQVEGRVSAAIARFGVDVPIDALIPAPGSSPKP